MCFSATASFCAGTLLTIAGVVTIKKTKSPLLLVFSSVPILFAMQQYTEGFMWLSLKNPNFTSFYKGSMYLYLFFAMVIWPTLIPVSVLLPEKNLEKRRILATLTGVGVVVSLFMTYCLIFCNVTATIMTFRIHYVIDYPMSISQYYGLLYFIPTVIPLFISSIKRMELFGFAIFLTFLVSHLYFKENVTSVWCFFAAIISVVILYIITKFSQNNEIISTPVK